MNPEVSLHETKAGKSKASFSGNPENNKAVSLTLLQFLLADVAYEIFTEEIVPQRFVDEPRTVLTADVMTVAPVVRLTGLPHSAGNRQWATPHYSLDLMLQSDLTLITLQTSDVVCIYLLGGQEQQITVVFDTFSTDMKAGCVPSSQRQTFSSSLSVRPIQK